MKINDYNATLDEKMSEFDMWVTPSLGEIRDTPQFRVNLEQLKKALTIWPILPKILQMYHIAHRLP